MRRIIALAAMIAALVGALALPAAAVHGEGPGSCAEEVAELGGNPVVIFEHLLGCTPGD